MRKKSAICFLRPGSAVKFVRAIAKDVFDLADVINDYGIGKGREKHLDNG